MEFNRLTILDKMQTKGFCPAENLMSFALGAEKDRDRIEANKILFNALLKGDGQSEEATHGPTIIHTTRPT